MNFPPIHWDHWRTFITVAEQRSLSAAARTLGITQPTASRHIDLLEQATGTTLFLRSPQGLMLSEHGAQMLPDARAMAASAAALARRAAAPGDGTRGIVRLSASEVVGTEILPAVLAPLLAAHPGLELELALSNRNTDLLHREADLALRMVRPSQSGLVARKLGDVRIGLYAHQRYLAVHGAPDSPGALTGHVLIGPDRDARMLAALTASGIAPRSLRFRCDREGAQIGAIRAGLGIGVLQVNIARRIPDLQAILPEHFHWHLECWLTMHADLRHDPRVRLVADHLARHLPEALAA